MEISSRGYERVLSLRELLSGVVPEKLSAALSSLLDSPTRVVSADGSWALANAGTLPVGARQLPLFHDLEIAGYLETTSSDDTRARAAAMVLESIMRSGARYFMASEMHIEVVQADFEELKHKHEALMASEARYKALAAQLEVRVKEQVETIETAHRHLYHAEKLASVGQLAAGVAHEINNPIGFIRSNLGTALSYVQKFQPVAQYIKSCNDAELISLWQAADFEFIMEDFPPLLQESIAGAERIARIVTDLKGFSNVDQTEEELVDLNESIRSACNVAANRINHRADLKLSLGELPRLRCKAGHLNQVFLNLLLNAAQAMKQRGEIQIKSHIEQGQIVISVADTGCGISPDILPRIFEPFFTTNDVGVGTGLGLTVCRDIILAHGGNIDVSSTIGAGTTVIIHLPIDRRNK